jgi:hypothetical protein
MLIVAPRDPGCSGWDALLRTRPASPSWFVTFNFGMFWGLFGLGVVVQLAAVALRREPGIARRGLVLIALSNLSIQMGNMAIFLKRGIVDSAGHSAFPCALHAFLYISVICVFSSVSMVRLIQVLNSTKKAERATQLHRVMMDHRHHPHQHVSQRREEPRPEAVSESESVSSEGYEGSAVSLRPCETISLIVVYLGLCKADNGAETEDQVSVERALRVYVAGNRVQAVLTMMLILYLPPLVLFGVLMAATPPYRDVSCSGCDLFIETLVLLSIIFVSFFVLRWRLARSVNPLYDPDRVVFEMKLGSGIMGVCIFSSIVLLAVDPAQLDWGNEVSWEWLLTLALTFAFYLYCAGPVLDAARSRLRPAVHRSSQTLMVRDVGISLENPLIMDRFQVFADQNFVSELSLFARDVQQFRAKFIKGKDARWRIAKANGLYNRYLREGAVLQVNVSFECRFAIQQALADKRVDVHIFDEAYDDVLLLIRYNDQLWLPFVAEGGCDVQPSMSRRGSKALAALQLALTPVVLRGEEAV